MVHSTSRMVSLERVFVWLCIVVASSTTCCSAFVQRRDMSSTTTTMMIKHQHPTISVQRRKSPMHYDRRHHDQMRTSTRMAATPLAATSITKSLAATMSALSKPSTALITLTEIGATTPPIVYFLSLFIAGFGVPISEDVLCIFAGTLLPTLSTTTHKTKLIIALYFGVVISDMITFSIGRMMRVGLLEPFRRRMNLGTSTDIDDDANKIPQKKKLGKRERAMAKLEKSGDWVGFVVRLSAGVRPAMMILAGFSGKVSYPKYLLGTAMGAIISLSVQLLFGYSMSRQNPAAILSNISRFLVVAPLSIVSVAGLLLLRRRYLSNVAAAESDVAEVSNENKDTTTDAVASETLPTQPRDTEDVAKFPVV